jgi:hypothetical protein
MAMQKVSLWPQSATQEQIKAYKRYITARNNVSLGQYRKYNKGAWSPTAAVSCSVDVTGLNHQVFEQNDDWLEYLEASAAWWAIEPDFRKEERMSMIRGDYGDTDSWREKQHNVKEI